MDTVRNSYDPLYYTMVRPLKKKNHCHDQVHTINITIINELISDNFWPLHTNELRGFLVLTVSFLDWVSKIWPMVGKQIIDHATSSTRRKVKVAEEEEV